MTIRFKKENLTPPTFRNIGKCIYCGSEDTLSDEHILPEGLGGCHVLRNASCEKCRKHTATIESFVLGQMFNPIRARMGLLKNKRAKKRIAHAKTVDAYGQVRTLRIDPLKSPVAGVFPIYAPPLLFNSKHVGYGESYAIISSESLWDEWKETTGNTIQVGMNRKRFALMLAKIGHALTVGELGTDSFDPFLPPIILEKQSDIYRFVGCYYQWLSPATDDYHKYDVQIRHHDGEDLVSVKLRLFANVKSPTYLIVTGRLRMATRVWSHASEL
ncbi:HNH endonuclease [Hyphococcus flavus]|uniref:HNH endonuclease n=1 Tax=Hyphococcus flavus TaxID=1866326 RepID=A0AAE9ZCD9_9PROT|nr:HNH endonuclease [Hyphococcus flavus]WDI30352.1 HNH endonuclease [Hyphococcus flavus]